MYKFLEKQHCHTLDGQPLYGTSTVIKEIMPPFLAKWGAQCAVDFLKENPEQWSGAVSAWSKVRQKAADKGTDRHSVLESYVTRMITDFDGIPQLLNDQNEKDAEWEKIQSFAKWSVSNIARFVFAEKNTYSRELWVGGIIDCVAYLKSGELVVIDFKSSREAYFNHFIQVGGYALQLDESGYGNENGENWQKLEEKVGALIIVPFGMKTLKPEKVINVQGFKDSFKQCVEIYKLKQAFENK